MIDISIETVASHCWPSTALSYLIKGPVLLFIFGELVLRFSLIRCGPIINFWYFGPADLLLDPGPFIRLNSCKSSTD